MSQEQDLRRITRIFSGDPFTDKPQVLDSNQEYFWASVPMALEGKKEVAWLHYVRFHSGGADLYLETAPLSSDLATRFSDQESLNRRWRQTVDEALAEVPKAERDSYRIPGVTLLSGENGSVLALTDRVGNPDDSGEVRMLAGNLAGWSAIGRIFTASLEKPSHHPKHPDPVSRMKSDPKPDRLSGGTREQKDIEQFLTKDWPHAARATVKESGKVVYADLTTADFYGPEDATKITAIPGLRIRIGVNRSTGLPISRIILPADAARKISSDLPRFESILSKILENQATSGPNQRVFCHFTKLGEFIVHTDRKTGAVTLRLSIEDHNSAVMMPLSDIFSAVFESLYLNYLVLLDQAYQAFDSASARH